MGEGSKKVESASDQSNDEIQLVSYIKNKIEETRGSGFRISQESVWMTNVAYLLGYDSVVYNSTTRQYQNTDNSSRFLKRNRVHSNLILPTVQNRLARLCKNPPRYDVRPNSASQEDKDAARLANQVLTMIWDKERINQKRLNLFMMMQQYGYAFMKISWDPSKGKDISDPVTGETIKEGDVRIEPVGPLGVFTDPLAKTMEDCSWLIQAKVRKVAYFQKYYPERGRLVKPESTWLLSLQYETRINALSQNNGLGSSVQEQTTDSAIELAYYEAPSDKHPKGRMVVTANGVLLEDKELPLGVIPFVKFDDVIVGDRFASDSIITHIRPLQDQYNKNLSRIAMWMNRLLAGKYIAPKGHGMIAESMNDQSGEIVEYNPQPNAPNGGEPHAMVMPQIPGFVFEEQKEIKSDMFDIAGIGEVSRGQLPAAGIPAIGMQFLMEQDDTRIGVVVESNEYSWADVGNYVLQFVSKNYITPRLLKIAGKNSEYIVREFVGADLKGNHDVLVIRGSTIPGSKVLRRQEILNTYQQGLLGDPTDPKLREKVLGMLEFGDISEMWHEQATDQAQFKRYLEMIKNEEMPPVSEGDNHPLFYSEANTFRKSENFDMMSDKSKAILEAFMAAHVDELVKLANPTMKMNNELTQEMGNQLEQEAQASGEPVSAEQQLSNRLGEPQ